MPALFVDAGWRVTASAALPAASFLRSAATSFSLTRGATVVAASWALLSVFGKNFSTAFCSAWVGVMPRRMYTAFRSATSAIFSAS